jgi:hypothetical protein
MSVDSHQTSQDRVQAVVEEAAGTPIYQATVNALADRLAEYREDAKRQLGIDPGHIGAEDLPPDDADGPAQEPPDADSEADLAEAGLPDLSRNLPSAQPRPFGPRPALMTGGMDPTVPVEPTVDQAVERILESRRQNGRNW